MITLDDLLKLPPSLARNALIRREWAAGERHKRMRQALQQEDVAIVTWEAERLLAAMPMEPSRTIQRRREDLLDSLAEHDRKQRGAA